jgi:hypothetical protein
VKLQAMLVLSCVLGLIGCTNVSPKTKPVYSIVDTRVELVKAQNDLQETVTALDGLEKASGDVRPAYEKFKKALAATEIQKNRAQERAVSMRENHAAYEKQWSEEASSLNNPDLKLSAEQRVAQISGKYDTIRELAHECRRQFAIFHTNLLDINRYLSNDLNAASIERAKPIIAEAKKQGDSLTSNLSELIAKMNELSAEMSPSGKVREK